MHARWLLVDQQCSPAECTVILLPNTAIVEHDVAQNLSQVLAMRWVSAHFECDDFIRAQAPVVPVLDAKHELTSHDGIFEGWHDVLVSQDDIVKSLLVRSDELSLSLSDLAVVRRGWLLHFKF